MVITDRLWITTTNDNNGSLLFGRVLIYLFWRPTTMDETLTAAKNEGKGRPGRLRSLEGSRCRCVLDQVCFSFFHYFFVFLLNLHLDYVNGKSPTPGRHVIAKVTATTAERMCRRRTGPYDEGRKKKVQEALSTSWAAVKFFFSFSCLFIYSKSFFSTRETSTTKNIRPQQHHHFTVAACFLLFLLFSFSFSIHLPPSLLYFPARNPHWYALMLDHCHMLSSLYLY
jgi:hypothetical protein